MIEFARTTSFFRLIFKNSVAGSKVKYDASEHDDIKKCT
jgi:hypothetical protein